MENPGHVNDGAPTNEAALTPPPYPDHLNGYGANVGTIKYSNEPATPMMNGSMVEVERAGFKNVPYLSEDEARTALGNYVASKCCYRKKPVTDSTFINLKSVDINRYVLQTFTETRTVDRVSTPYNGQVIISNGQPPPQPWDIQQFPTSLFNNEVKLVEIPNTAQVETCSHCSGDGTKLCMSCSGRGVEQCFHCHGSGRISVHNSPGTHHRQHEHDPHNGHHDAHHHDHRDHHHHHHHNHHEGSANCSRCMGTGVNVCNRCQRSGRVQCRTCCGSGRLKWFMQLKCTYLVNEDEYISRSVDEQAMSAQQGGSLLLPDQLVKECVAQNTFSEQGERVHPIDHHRDVNVNGASRNLIDTHSMKFSNSKIIAQRHDVLVIPITMCVYEYKSKQSNYIVYGLDHKVYAPKYPAKCVIL